MKKSMIFAALLSCGALLAADGVWNNAQTLSCWKASKNVICAVDGNTLKLSGIGVDCGIVVRNLKIDPAKYQSFTYKYQASGTSTQTWGQLYFAAAGEGFSDARRFKLPRLIPDGKVHTVTLPVPASWKKSSVITSLRFDPTDGAGGEIKIHELKFDLTPEARQSTLPKNDSWNANNKFANWDHTSKLTCEHTADGLKLTIAKRDSWIANNKVNLKTADYAVFTYRYRARGIENTYGQLFFAAPGKDFTDKNMLELPRLIADGQWHTVRLEIAKQPARRQAAWKACSTIAKLRFDATDSAKGIVEISELKFEKSSAAPVAAQSTAAPAAAATTTPVWNRSNKFAGWKVDAKLKMEKTAGTIKMVITGGDSRIINNNVKFVPGKYQQLIIRYRASNIQPGKRGQMFYALDGKDFTHRQFWQLPALQSDGNWHTMRVDVNQINDKVSWLKGKTVTKLRFDATDSSTGTVEVSEIRFSAAPAITANLLDADVWPRIKSDLKPRPAATVQGSYYKAVVISAQEDLQPHEVTARLKNIYNDFFLRREFKLKAAPVKAYIQFMADDHATAYINGKKAAEAVTWMYPAVADVTRYLKKDANVLAFHYRNGGNVGGVFGELYVEYADGSFERINTDEKFVSTITPPQDWNLLKTDLTKFRKVVLLPAPPAAPWRRKLAYNDYSAEQQIVKCQIPASGNAGKPLKLLFELSGNVPQLPFYGDITLSRSGENVWQETVKIEKSMVRKLSGRRWQIAIDYTLPLYMTGGKCDFKFESGSLYLPSPAKLASVIDVKSVSVIPGFEKAPVAKVKTSAYGPYFELNGKPFYYVSGNMNNFINPDPPTNTTTVGNNSFIWWDDTDKYNFASFDRLAETARRTKGDNYFFWNLTIFVPRKVLQKYPGHACLDEKGNIVRDGWGSIIDSHSFGSKEILEEMKKALIKAIEYLENSPYANRIIGYRVNGGHTIEWLGWEQKGSGVDFSPAAQRDFAEFAKKHYPELKDHSIPSLKARAALDNNAIVWDPQKHLNAIAFNEYYSTAIAKYVIAMTQAAKDYLKGRKLVGTYFGYAMTLNSNGNSQMRGHYALKTLLNSRSLDFLMSPQPYNVRNFGDTYGDMKPFATIKKYNVVSYQEDDTRTHLSVGNVGYHQAPNPDKTTQALRRGWNFTLCRNMPVLNIPMPGHYDYAQSRLDLPVVETVGQHCVEKAVKRNAEIALVVSEKSICYSPAQRKRIYLGGRTQNYSSSGMVHIHRRSGTPFTSDSFGNNYTTWARIGAPADYVLAEDLADNPGDYKLYVFVNCQVYDQKFLQAVQKLRNKKCTLLWMYVPGYTFNNRNSVENMKKLTALDLKLVPHPMEASATMTDGRFMGTPDTAIAPLFAVTDPNAEVLGRYPDNSTAAAAVKTGAAETIFCGPWKLDVKFASEIARRAGVKIYSRTQDPLEANESLITLHARTAGKKVIDLNQKTDVLDVFNKKIIARGVKSFSFEADLHDSPLFYCADDADELLKKLQNAK